MKKAIILGLLLMVLVSGCTENEASSADTTSDDSGSELQESQGEIESLDSDLSEMGVLIEDSNLDDIEFVELDDSTFE